LWAAPRLSAEKPSILQVGKDSLDITLYPSDDLKALETELLAGLRRSGILPFLKFKVNPAMVIFGSILISISIALVLGILATYGNIFTELLVMGNGLESRKGAVLGVTMLFVVVSVGFFPAILSSGEDSRVRDVMHGWYNKEDRVRRRLKYALQVLCSSKKSAISLWNPCAFPEDSWVWQGLIPAILDLNIPIAVHIKSDERDAFFSAIRGNDKHVEFTQLKDGSESSLFQELLHKNYKEIQNLLPPSEQILLEVLLVLSTYNTPSAWGNREKTARLRGLISLDLASFAVSRYVGNMTISHGNVDSKYLYTFFRRCVVDYQLIRPFVDGGERYWQLEAEVETLLLIEKVRQRHQYLQNFVETECFEVTQNVSDPVGLLIVFALLDSNESALKIKVNVLATMIERARSAEAYFLMEYFNAIKEGYVSSETGFDTTDFLRVLPISTLQQLIPLLERSGHFQDALASANFLRAINFNAYDLIIARLLERLGQYRNALELLERLNDPEKITPNLGADQSTEFELKLCLMASWVIVSGRLSEYQEAGKTYLQRAQKSFDKIRCEGKNCDPTLLWHYHNNLAQYFEWEADFSSCIDSHLVCQKLPGIELKWISGTNVNLGIAYRERFKKELSIDDLNRALIFGQKGVLIKRELGDNDELPIALHNLSLSQLCYFKINGGQDILKTARENAKEGLSLLYATQSVKKKGQLLAEALVSEKLIGDDNSVRDLSAELLYWQSNDPNPDDTAAVIGILDAFDMAELFVGEPGGKCGP